MRQLRSFILGLAGLTLACESPLSPDPQPAERFGAMTALIGGRAWVSSFFPDSAVAFYDPDTGFLQITGQEFLPETPPTLQFFIRTNAAVGAHHLAGLEGAAHAEWFTVREPVRPRPTAPRIQAFVSTGDTRDSLIIEELDVAGRRIRGRFAFSAQEFNGPRLVGIIGRFAGRLRVTGSATGLVAEE